MARKEEEERGEIVCEEYRAEGTPNERVPRSCQRNLSYVFGQKGFAHLFSFWVEANLF